jgi:hypothetical protein
MRTGSLRSEGEARRILKLITEVPTLERQSCGAWPPLGEDEAWTGVDGAEHSLPLLSLSLAGLVLVGAGLELGGRGKDGQPSQ